MRRRIIWLTAPLAVLLVVPAAPAMAAQSTLVSPDGDVTKATEVQVQLERDFGAERISEVHATLRRDGERLGQRLQLECEDGCDATDRRVLFGLPGGEAFDPATGAPFGADAPLPNGTYVLRVELLKNSNFQSDETFEHELHLAVRPSAPTDLAAEVDGDEVELTWTPSPEPDIDTYRVERHDGDDWETVTSTGRRSAVDEPGEGEHRYRVVAERPDGHGDTLERASDEITVELAAEDDDADAEDEGDRDEADEDDEEDREPAEDDADDDQRQESSSNERRDRSGSGTARAPQSSGDGTGSVPGLAEGEDEDGYSEELDYGGVGDGGSPDGVQVATPSGWRGTVDRLLDAEQIAVPIATGLVMTATGLHLWRWLRLPV